MNADDFQELYKLLRGSRSAIAVLDARALFLDDKMVAAHEKLQEAREMFLESRSRLLKPELEKRIDPKAKDADQQTKKLARKKKKVIETIEVFDELMPAVERLANRERALLARDGRPEEPDTEQDSDSRSEAACPPANAAKPPDLSQAFLDAYENSTGDERLEVISQHFGFREVQSEQDIHADSLYFIQTDDQSLLVRTPAASDMTDQVGLISVADDRPIKPFSRQAFIQLGADRKMVLLTKAPEG